MSQTVLRLLTVAFISTWSTLAFGQNQQSAPSSEAEQSGTPAQSDEKLTTAQIESLVAPIALYPDALLSQVLISSTYPLEVIEADRWLKANKSMKGDVLKSAVEKQKWDDSVKSLVATSSVLEMMSNQLSWMQRLGDAVLAQQPDVMDGIQRLRAKAESKGKLASTKQQKVFSRSDNGKQVIVIEPAEPETIYVPYYDPAVVYGDWPYPAYPPYYWPAPGYIAAGIISTGLAFGAGYALGRWASGGKFWGGGINWSNNNINIDRGNRNWVHNPSHRQGVRYGNSDVANRFGGNRTPGASARMDFRGRSGQQVLQAPAGGSARPSGGAAASARPGVGAAANVRPGSGATERPATRPSGDRGQSAAKHPSARGKAQANRPQQRPSGGGARRDTAIGNIGSGRQAMAQAMRGRASIGGGGAGGARSFGGGGGGSFGGGGGRSFGGGGGGGRGGGGRRSDLRLKHEIAYLGQLDNGLGFYRFSYNDHARAYVGVMAQEVQSIAPQAVRRGRDGFLRVRYDHLGLQFQTYARWVKSGAKLPVVSMP